MNTHKHFCIIFCIIFSSLFLEQSGFAQIPQSPNHTDENALRQGEWVTPFILHKMKMMPVKDTSLATHYRLETYQDGKIVGKVRDYYKNGQISREADSLVISNTSRYYEGQVIYYHQNSQIHKLQFFQNRKEIKNITYNLDSSEATESWLSLHNKGNDLLIKRKYQEALSFFKKARNQAVIEFGSKACQAYAIDCYHLGLTYKGLEQFEESKKLYIESIDITKSLFGKHHPDYAFFCRDLASIYDKLADYESAINLFQEAKETLVFIYGKNSLEYAITCHNEAITHFKVGEVNKAEQICLEAKTIYEGILDGKSKNLVITRNTLAIIYVNQQKFEEAESMFQENIQALRKNNWKEHSIYLKSLNNLTAIYLKQSRLNEAELILLEVKALQEKQFGEDNTGYARACENLARVYYTQWRFAEAEPLLLKAIEIVENKYGKNHPRYADYCTSLAALYQSQGLYTKAEDLFRGVKDFTKEKFGENNQQYAHACLNMANIYKIQKKYTAAKRLYLLAKRIYTNTLGKDDLDYASTCSNLASVYFSQEQYQKAKPLILESKRIQEKALGKNNKNYALSCQKLAQVYRGQKRYDEAKALFEEARAIQAQCLGKQHNDYIKSCNAQAYLYEQMEQFEEAEHLYLESIHLKLKEYERNLVQASEQEQSFYLKKNQYFFDDFKNFALNQAMLGSNHLLADLLNLQLTLKGYLLNNTVKIRNRILQSGDSTLLRQFRQWQGLKNQIAQAYNLTIKEREEKSISIKQWEEEVNQREKKLRLLAQDFAKARENAPIHWKQIQNHLQEGEAALEMVRMPFQAQDANQSSTIYLALLITPQTINSPDFLILKNGTELETKYLQNYHHYLRQFDVQDTTSYKQYWQAIYDYCKKNQIKKLYFAPDGVFHQINLNTLQNSKTRQYVLDEVNIHQINYLKDLLKPSKNAHKISKAILFGHPTYKITNTEYPTYIHEQTNLSLYRNLDLDQEFSNITWKPLPGTVQEVRGIAQTLKNNHWQTNIYLQKEASEEALKQVKNPQVLHLATHGFFLNPPQHKDSSLTQTSLQDLNPMYRSGIVLSGVDNYFKSMTKPDIEDGILTAIEASTLDLDHTELVVLSACETAQGDVAPGEGIYGLQRGFQIAGAKTIIMSLWKVKDVIAQQFMTSFYKKWQQGHTKREAFRITQKEMKSIYKGSPAYWGAFILIGE